MNPEQYAAAQAAITAGVASYVQRYASFFTGPVLSPRAWLDLLSLLFPEVQRRYAESALLGRQFYDSQRALHHPGLPRNERRLSELTFDQFVENMAPSRKEMSRGSAPKSAVTRVALSAVREVEMAARRQVIGAVKNDPELEVRVEALQEIERERRSTETSLSDKLESFGADSGRSSDVVSQAKSRSNADSLEPSDKLLREVEKLLAERSVREEPEQLYEEESDFPARGAVIGWARVATGRETCAWCLMLISRGAELNHKGNFAYAEAATAGINLDDETSLELWDQAGGDVEKFKELLYDVEADESYMEKWHTGCDCLAVPVFDANSWPGRDQAKRAQKLWIEAGLEADELIKSGKSRTQSSYTETLNALRRRLERGDTTMSNYAMAA